MTLTGPLRLELSQITSKYHAKFVNFAHRFTRYFFEYVVADENLDLVYPHTEGKKKPNFLEFREILLLLVRMDQF